MADRARNRGPWTHRALVWAFSIALGLLIYWLLSFVVDDIATWQGPVYEEIEQRMLDPQLVRENKQTANEIAEIEREIEDRKSRQTLLRDSTQSSEQTMNQLLDIHRLGLEKNVEPTEAEREALAEAEQLFLANQKQYQQLNTEIVQLNEQLRDLQREQRSLTEKLETAREPIRIEFQRQWQWHQMRLAAIKLAALLPLLLIAGVLFLRFRHSVYAPLIYAFGLALAAKITVVMHHHFPSRYFKYILILAALAIVTRILIYLLRTIASPSREHLLKQYREAYERFLCPMCEYPVRRGPLKYVFWSRSSIKKLRFPPQTQPSPEEPYICPACGTQLFEKCQRCETIRHSLLPVCTNCGNDKEMPPSA